MNGACNSNFFWLCPLGRGQKVKYHLISITKSISKIFIPNFVCVLTNERYKTYQKGFSFCRLGHAPGIGLRGPWGTQVVKKKFQTWSCGISNQRGWWAEENASKIFILGPNWEPWGEVKRSNIIKFQLPCQFQSFYTKLCVFSHIKENILNRIFILLLGPCTRGRDLGVLGICNAPPPPECEF